MKNQMVLLFGFAFGVVFSQEKLNEVKVETNSKGIQKSLKKVMQIWKLFFSF